MEKLSRVCVGWWHREGQNELRLTDKLGWTPQVDSSAIAEPKAEAEIDFQRYADGEDW
ncbi:MAG: hypothetical protein ABL994_05485 [Verrucomicrobiales bacterium]